MAIFGVGANHNNTDVSSQFIANNIVGVAWGEKDAPELHHIFRSMKVGDIVYIKACYGGKPITVKAIGIILNQNIVTSSNLVITGRNVAWLSTAKFVIPRPAEKNNVRNNTVYEEFHPVVSDIILGRIINR